MRVIIAHGPNENVRSLRQVVHGAGAECKPADCVNWSDLGLRLSQGDVHLVMVKVEQGIEEAWRGIGDAFALTEAPKVAFGPIARAELTQTASAAGIGEYLDEANLQRELDGVLERMGNEGKVPKADGRVISVLAPTPGSGGSTVAAHLAGSFVKKYPGQVGLFDLARWSTNLGIQLNVTPEHSVTEVCQRWHVLDGPSLRSSCHDHPSGVKVLVNESLEIENPYLVPEVMRRLAILARVAFKFTVFALDSQFGELEMEAARISNKMILVVRPDVVSVRGAQRVIAQLLENNVQANQLQLVVNRWGQGGQLTIRQIEDALQLKTHLRIADDPTRMNTASNYGMLLPQLTRLSTIGRQFYKLADSLNGLSKNQSSSLITAQNQ